MLHMRVTGADAKLCSKRDPAKVLELQDEEEKKRNYLEARLERRRHYPFYLLSGWFAWTIG
jgi:hypothetical protein